MIGKIYSSVTPFYDSSSQTPSYKKRPVLIISGPRNNDYTVLPISTITNRANLDSDYDVGINPSNYPLLNLRKSCYVRTHKQTTVHQASLTTLIGNMKDNYPDLYLNVLEKLDEFNQEIFHNAI